MACLQATLSPDGNIRNAAEAHLKDALGRQGTASILTQLALSDQWDLPTRQICSLFIDTWIRMPYLSQKCSLGRHSSEAACQAPLVALLRIFSRSHCDSFGREISSQTGSAPVGPCMSFQADQEHPCGCRV